MMTYNTGTVVHLLTLPEHLNSPPVFSVMFCRSLFVLLSLFFLPLYCVFFLDLQLLISLLVSSNFTYKAPLTKGHLSYQTRFQMHWEAINHSYKVNIFIVEEVTL